MGLGRTIQGGTGREALRALSAFATELREHESREEELLAGLEEVEFG